MKAYIDPPRRMPLLLRLGTWSAERRTGRPMLAARLLAWNPKAAIGAGVMESLVAHQAGKATARLLKLLRLQVSFMASCPFCIDMNSTEYADFGISDHEIEALQGRRNLGAVGSFSREGDACPALCSGAHGDPDQDGFRAAGRAAQHLLRTGDGRHSQHDSPGELLDPPDPGSRSPTGGFLRDLFHSSARGL